MLSPLAGIAYTMGYEEFGKVSWKITLYQEMKEEVYEVKLNK